MKNCFAKRLGFNKLEGEIASKKLIRTLSLDNRPSPYGFVELEEN